MTLKKWRYRIIFFLVGYAIGAAYAVYRNRRIR